MAAINKSIASLCQKQETIEKAKNLYHLAQARTGRGSGYVFAVNSLPAICAYLASQELNNTDVSEKAAQIASCVDRKTFLKALNTVRALLPSQESVSSTEITYAALVRSYRLTPPENAIQCMEDVELTFLDSLARRRYKTSISCVKCAIFYWTYSLMEVEAIQLNSLVRRFEIELKPVKNIIDALDKKCQYISNDIKVEAKDIRIAPPSPVKPSVASPSKSAMRNRSQTLTPAKVLALKRGVVFSQETIDEVDDDMPETPSKRRRIESVKQVVNTPPTRSAMKNATSAFHLAVIGAINHPPPTEEPSPHLAVIGAINHPPPTEEPSPFLSRTENQPSAQSNPSTPRHVRSSRPASGAPSVEMDVDEPEHNDPPPRRRYRPVFADQKQWRCRDPKLEAIWGRAQKHVDGMSNLYGNPLDKYQSQLVTV